MKLSIIIPVYNEEKTIEEVIKNLSEVSLTSIDKEIIVVDDGSTDNSKFKIKNSKFKELKFFAHQKNMGKGAAVRTGIKEASGDYILIQDADLEYNPKYIELLLQPILEKETEVVYGTRLKRSPNIFKDEKNPLFLLHYLGNRLLSFITSILYGQWITDMETGYKIFPKKAVEKMTLHAKSFDFEPEITAKLLKKDYKIVEIPITTVPRGYSEGKKLNAARDGAIALWSLLKYRFTD